MSDNQATLNDGDKTISMPIKGGTIGPDVIDIRKLYAETGKFTYDPGFTSTACCSTAAIRSASWPSIRASWK